MSDQDLQLIAQIREHLAAMPKPTQRKKMIITIDYRGMSPDRGSIEIKGVDGDGELSRKQPFKFQSIDRIAISR